MAKAKVPKPHKVREGLNTKSTSASNPDRDINKVRLKGAPYARSKATIKRLQMYRTGKAKRDSTGKITKPAIYQGWVPSGTQARVAPHQKWFGNTRVIKQDALQKFQEEMKKVKNDPYQVVMRQTQLPISLLNETSKHARVHLLDTEPYHTVFGKKKTRKRPALKVADLVELAKLAQDALTKYDPSKDGSIVREREGSKDAAPAWFSKCGQSRRVWGELYKVIDSSDVVIQVLDARDPLGTRSKLIEKHIKENCSHKHLIFVLNKVDLVPVWVTQKWVAILSRERPTMAFHSSITNSFGKGALISLLRQFSVLHKDKQNISVGIIGYPNVGKSSIINTLRAKKVCNVAPLAGETKVWQYVTLMNRIFLIDCPGVVPPSHETEEDMVLKGTVRIEYLSSPCDYIPTIMKRCRHDYLSVTYKVSGWKTADEFLEMVARRMGRLLRGGEPDKNSIAKLILNDWQRGRIPYFVPPAGHDSSQYQKVKQVENEELELQTRLKMEEEERVELLEAGVIARDEDITCRQKKYVATETELDISKPPVPGVRQNLGKIVTSVRYNKEDAGRLDPEPSVDIVEEYDSDDEQEEADATETTEHDDEDAGGTETNTHKEKSDTTETNKKDDVAVDVRKTNGQDKESADETKTSEHKDETRTYENANETNADGTKEKTVVPNNNDSVANKEEDVEIAKDTTKQIAVIEDVDIKTSSANGTTKQVNEKEITDSATHDIKKKKNGEKKDSSKENKSKKSMQEVEHDNIVRNPKQKLTKKNKTNTNQTKKSRSTIKSNGFTVTDIVSLSINENDGKGDVTIKGPPSVHSEDDDDVPMEGVDELSSSEDEDGAANFAVLAPELLTDNSDKLRITSAAPRYKKQILASKKKRKHTDDAIADFNNPATHVSVPSRERRKKLRDEKEAERPVRFYDIVNVKNKNRDKVKVIDSAMASRGHTKKKPKQLKK
uniref:Nucleolar GTP-binding protein 2 n=1 Tax=Hirondellea gigas TaxID=1518452 RepID=A0A2P2HYV0_9CRUS